MARIVTNTTVKNPYTKFHFDKQCGEFEDVKDIKEAGPVLVSSPNFAELHALFEIQYEQFLTDTSAEIEKHAQRLSELESIIYGNPSSE